MTTAMFVESEGGYRIRIFGHANYNPGGPDIVCSACSTLTCTLLQAVLSMEAAGELHDMSYKVDDGDFYLKTKPNNWSEQKFNIILRTIIDGFALLQQKYPENVVITTKSGEK